MLMCLRWQWSSMRVISIRVPARGGGTGSGRRGSWPSSGRILFWCQCLSLSLANPLTLSPWVGPVLGAMEASLITQVHEIEEQIRGFMRGKTSWPRSQSKQRRSRKRLATGLGISWTREWTLGLKLEVWSWSLSSSRRREIECKGKSLVWSDAHQGAASSVSGKFQGASAGPRPPRKKKAKQKRNPGLPSWERQEYYKSYLAHLSVLTLF